MEDKGKGDMKRKEKSVDGEDYEEEDGDYDYSNGDYKKSEGGEYGDVEGDFEEDAAADSDDEYFD